MADSQKEYDRRFRDIVAELIVLESRNHEQICARRQAAHQARERNHQALQNLRSVGRAYGAVQPMCWQSYS